MQVNYSYIDHNTTFNPHIKIKSTFLLVMFIQAPIGGIKSSQTALGFGTKGQGSSGKRYCVQLKPFPFYFFLAHTHWPPPLTLSYHTHTRTHPGPHTPSSPVSETPPVCQGRFMEERVLGSSSAVFPRGGVTAPFVFQGASPWREKQASWSQRTDAPKTLLLPSHNKPRSSMKSRKEEILPGPCWFSVSSIFISAWLMKMY